MALEDIVKKILDDAGKEAKSIFNQYQVEVEHITSNRNNEFEKHEKESRDKIDHEAEEYYKRMVQMAELEMRKECLHVKQQLLTDLFKMVEDRIVSLPKENYQTFISRKIAEYIATGSEEIVISERDKDKITPGLIEKLNLELKEKLREKGQLKLATQYAPIKAGFILKSDNIQLNCSIEALLKQLQGNLETEMIKRLFKGE